MGFLPSILPAPASWTLTNASFDVDGNLVMNSNSTAACTVTTDIKTSTMSFICRTNIPPVRYNPNTLVDIKLVGTVSDGDEVTPFYKNVCIPISVGVNFVSMYKAVTEFIQDIEAITSVSFKIRSKEPITFYRTWLCPEADVDADTSQIKEDLEEIKADYVSTTLLETKYLTAEQIGTDYLSAMHAIMEYLYTEELEVREAAIEYLRTHYTSAAQADILEAVIIDLTVTDGRFTRLSAGLADIETLVNGNLTSDNIQSLNLTSLNTTIQNGLIKDAMIENVSANKINSGEINTNLVDIRSESGNLVIADNTIQVSDGTVVRVQIGKDASDDYNMYVWDAAGSLMFDATGIHEDAIKSAIIRNDMVSDTANISASKLDIASLFETINNDGTHTLLSSKVLIDLQGQTLDIKLNEMITSISNIDDSVATNTTQIGIVQGKIDTIITQTAIDELSGQNKTFWDRYSATEQTIDGIRSVVGDMETTIGTIESKTQGAYTVKLESTNGHVFKEGEPNIALQCSVFEGNNNITELIAEYRFSWKRISVDVEADAIWNNQGVTGYEYQVTSDDLSRTATFSCEVNIPIFKPITTIFGDTIVTISGDNIVALT